MTHLDHEVRPDWPWRGTCKRLIEERRKKQELTSRDRVSGHPLREEELPADHGLHGDVGWKEIYEGLTEQARPHLAGVH